MTWFLNVIYLVLTLCGSPWLVWRAWKGKNRRGWSQKLFGSISPDFSGLVDDVSKPCVKQSTGTQSAKRLKCSDDANVQASRAIPKTIWFHAVSVGEVNLLTPVLDELRLAQPETRVAISTTTETGYDLAKKRYPNCYIFFCPFDFSWAVNRVLDRLSPSALVLVELEMWPNLIALSSKRKIPVVVINARLSENSARGYGRLKWLLVPTFQKLNKVLCQNEVYSERFVELGCRREDVLVTGNVKFDHIQSDRENPATKRLVGLARINSTDKVFIAGSTQVEEDLMVANAFKRLVADYPELRLILVPRHTQRVKALVSHLDGLGLQSQLRSTIGADLDSESEKDLLSQNGWHKGTVLIVDVIGELGGWWGRADIAFVGGSMGSRGGQNMIEPAGYGVPVCFGPNTSNFQAIVDQLIESNASKVVHSMDDISSFAKWVLTESKSSEAMGQRAKRVVLAHLGASQRTVDSLCGILGETENLTGESAKDTANKAA